MPKELTIRYTNYLKKILVYNKHVNLTDILNTNFEIQLFFFLNSKIIILF
jgi:hypothetical protein